MMPPVSKRVLRRRKSIDHDMNTFWGEFAVKDPLSPSRSKEFGWNNYAFCLRNDRPLAKRFGFLVRA